MCNFPGRVTFAVIGVVVGLSAAAAFGPVLQNPDAAIFGLLSGIIAAVTLTVHILNRKGYWNYTKNRSLVLLLWFGCFIQLVGFVGFAVYIATGTIQYQKDHYLPIHGRSFYLAAVWCFMTWKWGFLLFFSSRLYLKVIRQGDKEVIVAT